MASSERVSLLLVPHRDAAALAERIHLTASCNPRLRIDNVQRSKLMKAVMLHCKTRWKSALGEEADRLSFRTPDGWCSGGSGAPTFVIQMDWSVAELQERVRAEKTRTLRIEYLFATQDEQDEALVEQPSGMKPATTSPPLEDELKVEPTELPPEQREERRKRRRLESWPAEVDVLDLEEQTAAAALAATVGNGLTIADSEGGLGLFAQRDFGSMQFITMYEGDALGYLEPGQTAACQLDVQTHVTQCGGFYVDGYPLSQAYRRDPQSIIGHGGGTFANHAEMPRVNAETVLGWRGAGLNAIYLRVKKGKAIRKGEEVLISYGREKEKAYQVAMGISRFELLGGPSCGSTVVKSSGRDRRLDGGSDAGSCSTSVIACHVAAKAPNEAAGSTGMGTVTLVDCGKCVNCLDKRRFGGTGRRKQRCLQKQATQHQRAVTTGHSLSKGQEVEAEYSAHQWSQAKVVGFTRSQAQVAFQCPPLVRESCPPRPIGLPTCAYRCAGCLAAAQLPATPYYYAKNDDTVLRIASICHVSVEQILKVRAATKWMSGYPPIPT